ncbi:MAG: hypothetical protein HY547_09575 [Elusimicrobia bacterium]|nr:hypothetical protein [Elusimicrobiota bacterium]
MSCELRVASCGFKRRFFFVFFLFLTLNPPLATRNFLWALGVKTITGKIHLEGVPVGTPISLYNVSGQVYRVTNTSEVPYEFNIDLEPPGSGDQIGSFEVLPNFNWVRMAQNNYLLAPGQEALIDIIFDFPADSSLFGRRFVCFVVSGNVSKPEQGMGVSAKVKSKFTMVLRHDYMTPEQKEKITKIRQRVDFEMKPSLIHLDDFPKGKKLAMDKDLKKAFKIINPNDYSLKMTIEPFSAKEAAMIPKEGYAEGSMQWIQVHGKEFEIEADNIFKIPVSIEIPKTEKRTHFMFVIKITLAGYDVPVSSYGRIYVITKDGEQKPATTPPVKITE